MNTRYARDAVLWFLPVIMLLISILPIELPIVYGLLLQIVVSITAAIIAYLLFTQKPKNYIIWGIVFVIIVLIYNPFIKISIIMNIDIPLSLITAIIYLCNWWFVFFSKSKT